MIKRILLILLCLPMIGFGQGWTKTFETNHQSYGRSVQQTTDGGYIITGGTNSITGDIMNVYLLKTDASGIEQWTKTFGGTDYDRGYSVQQTTDGGYIIVGETSTFGNGGGYNDVYLIKTDASGIEQWSETFGGSGEDVGSSVQQTTDGGYIITGNTETNIFGMTETNVYLIKTDGSGIEQWTKTFMGLGYYAGGNSVQQTTDGGYIITGFTEFGSTPSYGGFHNVYLIKTDANGIEQWSKDFGESNCNDEGKSVQQTNDGGYIIAGTYAVANGGSSVYLIKTDVSGIEEWAKTFGGTDSDFGKSVQQTTDGGFIVTGYTRSFSVNGNGNVYLLKTDASGIEQWSRAFVGVGTSSGFSVQQTTDGGYIVSGYTSINGSSGDSCFVYLIKTNAQGIATSTFNIPTPNSNRKLEKTVDMLGKQTKPQTNIPFIEIYDDGTVEKRIVIE